MSVNDPRNDVTFSSEANASGVSWSAVAGGAVVAASLALILIVLGVGLGLSSISPWSGTGASAKAIGFATIIWLIATQIIASGLGGYLAGRLRTRWSTLHSDEVYFRDTAHGFLAWAVAVIIAATFFGSVVSSILGGGAKIASTAATAELTSARGPEGSAAGGYLTDLILRPNKISAESAPAVGPELGRILTQALHEGALSDSDRAYAARIAAAHTGLSQDEAEKRIDAVYTQGKVALDTARSAAAKASLWTFVALLTGAFTASLAATIGGRQRDQVRQRSEGRA